MFFRFAQRLPSLLPNTQSMRSGFWLCGVLCLGILAQNATGETIRIGLSVWSHPSNNQPILEATQQALEKAFGKDRVSIKQYGLQELHEAIRTNQVDVFQSSAGFYRRQQDLGVRALATVASARFPDPNRSEGAAIIVRKDRLDLQSLADAKGKILAANSPEGFTGFQVPMGEIVAMGADPKKFFSKILFSGTGRRVEDVIHWVLNGKADVGFLRLCYLEHFPELARQLRVLNPQPIGEDGCACSTERYPTWTMSATSRTSPEISRITAATLLSMPATSDGYYWGVANDYSSVDTLFKRLKIGPYEYLNHWTVQRFLTQYWPFVMLGLFLLAGLIYHGYAVERINQRQTKKLHNALSLQEQLETEARMTLARLGELQRVGVVGLLSTMVAHELNQPLAAIMMYTRGLSRLRELGRLDKMDAACDAINQQAKRAFEIVEKVRSYAKGNTRRTLIDLSQLVEKCVNDFQVSRRLSGLVHVQRPKSLLIHADAVELEIVIHNLLKNAAEELHERNDGRIDVAVQSAKSEVHLTIADNGHIFSAKELAILSEPHASDKRSGLGLGLALVRCIVEKHGGRIVFESNFGQGLRVIITLPAAS